MAEQQEDTSEIFFQTWTVPPQPLVNTQIVSETNQQAIPLSIVSTDTTAIKAFDYATGIAVFLALCATGLAYWFGVKSFDLTTKSFKLVVEETKTSTLKTLQSNSELYKSQEKLKEIELNHLRKGKFENNFHEKISTYLTTFSSFKNNIILDILHIDDDSWQDFKINPPSNSEISYKFYNCHERMLMLTVEISFLLNLDKEISKDLMVKMGELNKSTLKSVLLLVEGKQRMRREISDLDNIRQRVHDIAIQVSKSLNNLKD